MQTSEPIVRMLAQTGSSRTPSILIIVMSATRSSAIGFERLSSGNESALAASALIATRTQTNASRIDDAAELLAVADTIVAGAADERYVERGDTGFAQRRDAIADEAFGTDQRRRIDERLRNRGFGFFLLACEIELLNTLRFALLAVLGERVVVEVLRAGTHPTDVERHLRATNVAERLETLADRNAAAREHFERGTAR